MSTTRRDFVKYLALEFEMSELQSEISFVDSRYKRHVIQMTKLEGSLVDP